MRTSTLAAVIATFSVLASPVLACYPHVNCICETDPDSLQCQVCGDPNSSGITCLAYNATFDDLTTKKFSSYQSATWSGFTAVPRSPANPIIPNTPKKLAKASTGKGVLGFSTGIGGLHTFNFACSDPTKPHDAVACSLNVLAQTIGDDGDAEFFNGTFDYVPDVTRGAMMAGANFEDVAANAVVTPYGGSASPYFVTNYTFDATMADGCAAVLYLDTVILNTWDF